MFKKVNTITVNWSLIMYTSHIKPPIHITLKIVQIISDQCI